jgi:hypothetical protein
MAYDRNPDREEVERMMNGRTSVPLTLAAALTLGGCQLVESVFKVGFWAGAIMIAFVLALVFFLFRLLT